MKEEDIFLNVLEQRNYRIELHYWDRTDEGYNIYWITFDDAKLIKDSIKRPYGEDVVLFIWKNYGWHVADWETGRSIFD